MLCVALLPGLKKNGYPSLKNLFPTSGLGRSWRIVPEHVVIKRDVKPPTCYVFDESNALQQPMWPPWCQSRLTRTRSPGLLTGCRYRYDNLECVWFEIKIK